MGLGFTAILCSSSIVSIHLSLSVFLIIRQLPSKLAERYSTIENRPHVRKSVYDLKIHVRNFGYALPQRLRCQTTSFEDFAT